MCTQNNCAFIIALFSINDISINDRPLFLPDVKCAVYFELTKASSHCTHRTQSPSSSRVCSSLLDLVQRHPPQRIVVDVLHEEEWKSSPITGSRAFSSISAAFISGVSLVELEVQICLLARAITRSNYFFCACCCLCSFSLPRSNSPPRIAGRNDKLASRIVSVSSFVMRSTIRWNMMRV